MRVGWGGGVRDGGGMVVRIGEFGVCGWCHDLDFTEQQQAC